MKEHVIYELAARGTLAEEPKTKDIIFKAIMGVVTGQYDYLRKETKNFKMRDDLTVENVLRETHYQQRGYVRLTTQEEINDAKNKYSTYKGYPKLQLALDFFQMSNDLFFRVYGFNYVPEGKLRDAARKRIDMQMTMSAINSVYGEPVIGIDMGFDVKPVIADTTIKSALRNNKVINDTFMRGSQ